MNEKLGEPAGSLLRHVTTALLGSLGLVLVLLYLTGSWFSGDWWPFNGTGRQDVPWGSIARIATPAAALIAASVAAVLGYHGQVTKAAELENDRDVAVTARYSQAIEHLANEALTIRMGGLYALERIAMDSPRDRQLVAEVLGAYVRSPGTVATPTDLETAIFIAGRSKARGWGGRVEFDFSGADLSGVNMSGADLGNANLQRCNLSGAVLNGSALTDAQLSAADLGAAQLIRATLVGAVLTRANLTNADLTGANMSHSDVTGAELEGAIFDGAILTDCRGLPADETDNAD